ncbi:MAG: ATP-binding protein [Rudaea sp.]
MSVAPATTPIDAEAALRQLGTGIAVLDPMGMLIYANPAFCELFAVSSSPSRGLALRSLGEAATILAALAERVRQGDSNLRLRGQRLQNQAGRLVQADIEVGLWRSEHMLIEVHELGGDNATSATSTRLSESLRGLAHEVKNPLAGVRGAAQLLKRRLADPELARLAELIMVEADRLVALSDRLLQPGGKPHLSLLNLHEVAERARALIAAEAEPGLRLDRDYDPSLPTLHGNHDRLLQLVLNLMRNALQARARAIGLRSRAEHNVLIGERVVRLVARLDVIDDGDGVPEGLRDTLFMPLVSGRSSGTGLGLALAREIAQEHGGTLTYHSRSGRTVFTLLLPLGSDSARSENA